MHDTRDPLNPMDGEAKPSLQKDQQTKTIDLGIDGLAPAVHLGAGGSANVWAAKKVDTGEAVAVKLLRASADSEKERIRFDREQETLQRLVTHDGIVPVLDAGLTDREEPYFLMPLMEGSLQDRIDRDGPLDWQTATQLVAQVADAVAFAHGEHVLHRDLKPGNILLDGSGIPRVSDFGIAKLMDSSVSKSSKSLGTPSFMPPERFNGFEATEESDVYGLGATLAALITGTAPFLTGANDTDVAVMMRVVTEEPPTLEGFDVPEEVALAVAQSMAKDPADRPATASEFAAQLRMAIEPHVDPAMSGPVTVAIPRRNITIPDAPITGPEKGWTVDPTTAEEEDDRRKAPILLFAAAAILIVGVLGIFGLSTLGGDDDDPTELASVNAVAGDIDEQDDDSSENEPLDAAASDDAAAGGAAAEEAASDDPNGSGDDADAATSGNAGDNEASSGTTGGSDGDTPGNDDAGASPELGDGVSEEAGSNVADQSTANDAGSGNNTVSAGDADTDGGVIEPEVLGTVEQNTTTTTTTTTEAPPAEPVACFSASRTAVETGDTVRFTNCSTDATSYSWDLDGRTSTSASTSTSWTTTGTKTVRLTARGEGGTDTQTITITVSATPPPPVPPSACFNASSTSVETNQSVTFSNCSTDATSYSWDFGDGTSSTLTSPSKSWSSAGSRTVRLTATGPDGTDTTSRTITVTNPPPPPNACFTASATTVDVGQSVSFSNCSDDATSYSWDFGDGTSSTATSPSKSWSSAGSRTVRLTASGNGKSDSTTRTITVNAVVVTPEPDACFNPSATTIEEGGSVTFTNCSSDASSYSWTFGDGGTSTQFSPTHTFDSDGSFTVRLTARGDGGEDSTSRTITVNVTAVEQMVFDQRAIPDRIRCTTNGPGDWSWTWTTLPAWVNDYIVEVGGSRVSVGGQPSAYRTSDTVTAIIAVDKNNKEGRTSVDANSLCPAVTPDGPPVPTGVSCSFSNFRWENDVWTWQENWSWSAVSGISYRVNIETNGSPSESGVGGSSVSTNPSNGVPSSGQSVKAIIAVDSNGDRAIRNVNPCGNEGGSGWVAPTPR